MAIGGFYAATPHRSQYDPSSDSTTRREGCVPTTGANGANASSGGKISRTADQVRALVPKSAETDPHTPGWSLTDLDRAMAKLGVGFEVRTGKGWAGVVQALDAGYYVALEGDSDQFGNDTCSGTFDGNHCIGVHPATRTVGGLRQRWIDDPVCKVGRWEYEWRLHRYARKLREAIGFGVFTTKVPKAAVPPPAVTLRYGGVRIPTSTKRIRVQAGRRANVRTRPTTAAKIVATLPNGATFRAYQRTRKGTLLAGSRTWYGDRTGTRWLHVSAF